MVEGNNKERSYKRSAILCNAVLENIVTENTDDRILRILRNTGVSEDVNIMHYIRKEFCFSNSMC